MNTPLKMLRYALMTGTFFGPAVSVFAAIPVVANDVDNLIIKVLCPILNYLFTIALIVGILMALVAAYKYLTSSGDATKVSEAHKTLTYAAIGIAVAILAGSFPLLVGSLLGWQSVNRC